MKYSIIIISLLLLCVSSGCASFEKKSGSDLPGAKSPSELNSNAKEFDGKYVTVKGYMIDNEENTSLWDSKNALISKEINVDQCISVIFSDSVSRRMIKFDKNEVIVNGIFHKSIRHSKIIRLGLCNWSAIEISDSQFPTKIK